MKHTREYWTKRIEDSLKLSNTSARIGNTDTRKEFAEELFAGVLECLDPLLDRVVELSKHKRKAKLLERIDRVKQELMTLEKEISQSGVFWWNTLLVEKRTLEGAVDRFRVFLEQVPAKPLLTKDTYIQESIVRLAAELYEKKFYRKPKVRPVGANGTPLVFERVCRVLNDLLFKMYKKRLLKPSIIRSVVRWPAAI